MRRFAQHGYEQHITMDDHTYAEAKSKELSEPTKKELKRKRDRRIQKSRVNIGIAFSRWKELMKAKEFQRDAEVACFLLDSYESTLLIGNTSTPMKSKHFQVPTAPALSSISSGTDRDEHLSAIVDAPEIGTLEQSMHDMSIDEEELNENAFNDPMNSVIDWAEEGPSCHGDRDDSSDDEYLPPISLRMGGALKGAEVIENLPTIGIDETVHDLTAPDQTAPSYEPMSLELPILPGPQKVLSDDDIVGVRAALLYENCLRQLVTFLTLPVNRCTGVLRTGLVCDSVGPFSTNITFRGTAMIVEWGCPNGHCLWRWNSQPVMKFGMQAGDFLLSTNILLSGNNYAKVALLFKFMNMRMVNRSTHFTIQDTYCIDPIKEFWEEKRSEAISRLQGKEVVLLGDGRNDSPGHSAQYCSYTTMELDSKEIVHVATIDKRQTNWNSNIMEKQGFIQTVDKLTQEIKVVEFCTDAHVQIAALLNPDKGRYKDLRIHHSLDMWHGAKSLAKKISTAAKMKGQAVLLHWLRDIVNHFWWCCKTAETFQEFLGLWIGVLHHVCNNHTWETGSCQHDHLEDIQDKEWIERDSKSHKALVDIVLNKRWQKDVHKYLRFRSTAHLESFQNHILMYASKRQAFTPRVYDARVVLAALDYNFHRERPAYRTAEGQQLFKKKYNKNARRYSLYTVKCEKSYAYIPELQARILKGRFTSGVGMPRKRTLCPDDPRRLGVVPPILPPPTSELLRTHVSRGLGSAFHATTNLEAD
ncbi:uncharacterized protein [Paramisgurnus dabryanus]|uniref:uncharacterized protein isoform X1 n=1 Tax=Paramisgurnus dabryanus TaxID=90735 RepID=UPI003CCF4F40